MLNRLFNRTTNCPEDFDDVRYRLKPFRKLDENYPLDYP